MGRIISVANQKGGVGKTTTTVSLASCLAWAEKDVLLIDIDPQANASSGLGVSPSTVHCTIYDVLIGRTDFAGAVFRSEYHKLDLIPSTQDLTGAEVELVDIPGRESLLKGKMPTIRPLYDYIFIDCPPSLGLLTVNALTASDSVIMPIQCEYYALEGLTHLMNTIERVRRNLNPGLLIEGILLTMFDGRTRLSAQVEEEVRRFFGERVFRTVIPRNVKLSEAPSFGKPIIHYDMRSTGAGKYVSLAQEILDSREGREKSRNDEEKESVQTEKMNAEKEEKGKKTNHEEEIGNDEEGVGTWPERFDPGDRSWQGS